MRKLAALAALLVALPAAAQTQVVPYNGNPLTSGPLTTSGDVVTLTVSGSQWSTIVWTVVGAAGTSRAVTEYSYDGGINFIASPYSKRIDAVAANPSVLPLSNSLLTSTSSWETQLPSNATHFRLRCSTSGTTSTVQLAGGAPYVPGAAVAAVLYDSSVTAGANNNTGTLDATGWRSIVVSIVIGTAATGAASLNVVDDVGGAIAVGTSASIAVGTFAFGWGDAGTFGTANPFTMVGGVTSLPLDRRFNVSIAGATTSATRTRVVARR